MDQHGPNNSFVTFSTDPQYKIQLQIG